MPRPTVSVRLSFVLLGCLALTARARAQFGGPILGAEEARMVPADLTVNDIYGTNCDIDGDTIVFGNPYDSHPGLNGAGSAYVFVRSGGAWTQQAKLISSDIAANDFFGGAVAIDGDTIVVGAEQDSHALGFNAGAAYVFVRNGTTWTEQQKLIASDAAFSDSFGTPVAISGDTILVAAQADDLGTQINPGSVYVFVRNGGVWTEQARLNSSDHASFEQFGWSAALDGDTAIVGVPFKSGVGANVGAAYVFTRSGSTWSQQQKIVAFDAATQDWFASSVAVSGDTAIVGANHDDQPGISNAGSAYVFKRNAGAWSLQQKLLASSVGVNQYFGESVAVEGNTAVVGMGSQEFTDSGDPGAVYVYTRSGVTWSEETVLWHQEAQDGDELGDNVALDGGTLAVGAPYSPNNGALFAFRLQTAPATYCTAKLNSQGCAPTIVTAGMPSLTNAAPFSINAVNVLNNKSGLLFYGLTPANGAFQGGFKCVEPPTLRTAIQNSGGNVGPDDCSGTLTYNFNARIQSGLDPQLDLGRDVFAQYWSRDPGSTPKTSLTNAVHFSIQP